MDTVIKTTPAEKWVINPLNRFISKSTTGGIVLFVAALIAIILANSPLKDAYHEFWEHKIGFGFDNDLFLNYSIHHWVNDGLMAIFFFVVGLELKREIMGGELSKPRKAILPIAAAIGGMVFPALIYAIFNYGTDSSHGWGIPMATDIAFALGVLYLLGDRVPLSLKIFLTALAIVDDLGAILVIAFFYTEEINYVALALGVGLTFFLFISKELGVRNILYYAIIGIMGVWLVFLLSGVHATIASILVAFTIPAHSRVNENIFIAKIQNYLEAFKKTDSINAPYVSEKQSEILEEIRTLAKDTMTPLHRLERSMHSLVIFIVMPIFALANAGVTFSNDIFDSLLSNVSLGVIFGLLAGKIIGIYGVSYAMVKFKLAELPAGMTKKSLLGVGLLASIGFTMSLFVTNLAFDHPEYELQAKLGIFVASIIGGTIGYIVLSKSFKKSAVNSI